MNVNAYLNRIQSAGPVDTTIATLRQLHYQHLLTVPLENLNIYYGREIVLEPEALFTKIVTQKRGGFCYELNGLFYELLRAIGFSVKRVSGRVYEPGKGFKNEFDHLAIIARINNIDWLVDVGFGRRFSHYPIPLILNQIQEDSSGCYMIATHDETYLAIQQQDEAGAWVAAYIFTLVPRELSEFVAMCHYHQTSPASFFTQNKLCTLVTAQGRITLTDDRLKITEGRQSMEEIVTDTDYFEFLLTKHFSIHMKQDGSLSIR